MKLIAFVIQHCLVVDEEYDRVEYVKALHTVSACAIHFDRPHSHLFTDLMKAFVSIHQCE